MRVRVVFGLHGPASTGDIPVAPERSRWVGQYTADREPGIRVHGKPFGNLVDERHRGPHFTHQKRRGAGRANRTTRLLQC